MYSARNISTLLCAATASIAAWAEFTPVITEVSDWPALLSETGAFDDLSTLEPAANVLPYEPNVSFWSDHALKRRWVYLPEGQTIAYSENDPWEFPEGTVFIKHFDLELTRGDPSTAVRVETRFLVITASSAFGLSYQWNEEGTDANLVTARFAVLEFPIVDGDEAYDQMWLIPSSNCADCHTPFAGHALSFNTRQLNKVQSIEGAEQNMIEYLSSHGLIDTQIESAADLPFVVPADDERFSINERARSYIDVNCASCHFPGSGLEGGSWDARYHVPLQDMDILDVDSSTPFDSEDRKILVRGDLDHSTILNHIKGEGAYSPMPPLGSFEQNESGIALMEAWITEQLTEYLTYEEWQAQYFENPESLEAEEDQDPDEDGDTNRMEFANRTDPNDPHSLGQTRLVSSGDGVKVEMTAGPFASYQLEGSSDLVTWERWDGDGNRPTERTPGQDEAVLDIPIDDGAEAPVYWRGVVSER